MNSAFLKEKFSQYLCFTVTIGSNDLIAEQEALRSIPLSQAAVMYSPEQVYGTQGKFAGGGIAKLAGDRSGAMLESMNPDKDGLPGLLKRVKKL